MPRGSQNPYSTAEIDAIALAYSSAEFRGDIDLAALSAKLGRPKSSICRKAKELGFAGKIRAKPYVSAAKYATEEERRSAASVARVQWIAQNGHPRGMAGRNHSEQTKQSLRVSSLDYRASLSPLQAADIATKAMKTTISRYGKLGSQVSRGNWKAGWREIGGKRNYYRSRWEANYARYLQWLKENGQIIDWQHEPETFWFESIRRGVRSYLPDFRVTENDHSLVLHEVKGWMDSRSKTTLARMAKYYPQQKLVVVREKQYNSIARSVGRVIEGWEDSGRSDRL